MSKPTETEIITRALALLAAGLLASQLPGRLMDEFNLTPDRARKLAGEAINQIRGER